MKSIDWFAVQYVVSERRPLHWLRPVEKRMIVRRLSERMLTVSDRDHYHCTVGKMTAAQVADLLGIDPRSVQRILAELPKADKRECPRCSEDMWVVDGIVEPHPTVFNEECSMTGQRVRRGLAGIRPDLYQWAEVAV